MVGWERGWYTSGGTGDDNCLRHWVFWRVKVAEGSCRGKLQEEAEEVRGLIISAAVLGLPRGVRA
jgi:hypothetical protein